MKTAPVVKKLSIAKIDAASYNPRKIEPAALAGLQESLSAYGLLEMPVVNTNGKKLVLIGGHQRVTALKAEGVKFVDCVLVDFDATRERMANVALNNTATQGKFDTGPAAEELQRIISKMGDHKIAGFDALMEELKGGLSKIEARASMEKETAEVVADEAAPVSAVGGMYKLGRHKLWCGKMQDGAKKLLSKYPAAACVTDPPYNVDFTASVWLPDAKVSVHVGDSIDNDALPVEQWQEMATEWFRIIVERTNGPVALFYASRMSNPTLAAWGSGGGVAAWSGLWVKDIPAVLPVARKSVDYHYQTEPFLVGWRSGLQPKGIVDCWNVLRHPRQRRNQWHPTEKPVALMRTLVERHAPEGAIVYDPFLGGGSTLMACEASGHICVGSELSPVYCDRIRRRWATEVHGAGCDWLALTPGN